MHEEERFLVDDREVVVTPHMHVRCDGGNGALGHPVEYITLERGAEAVCKYCGRHYVHVSHPEAAAIVGRGERYAA